MALKHDAMSVQDSLTRAIREGAGAAVVKAHQNPHQSEAAKPIQDDSHPNPHPNPHRPAELENTAKDVICGLVKVIDGSPSCPTRT